MKSIKITCWNCQNVGEYNIDELEVMETFMKTKKSLEIPRQRICTGQCNKCGNPIQFIEVINEKEN